MTSTADPMAAPASQTGLAGAAAREQTRARYPDSEGFLERDGVRIFYEVYGDAEVTVLLLPTWSIVHSRAWKAQIPYLARHCRVVTFDGRGNGRSDRPAGGEAYRPSEFAADALAVMDATETEHAFLVGESCGAQWATILAADHPQRADAIIYIAPAVGLAPNHPERDEYAFDEPYESDEGWAKYNSRYWCKDYLGFLEFFFAQCFTEPHSTKQIEDGIGWALQTTPETLADTTRGLGLPSSERFRETCARVRCPTLVIHGDGDLVRPLAQGRELAKATGGELITLEDAGHLPTVRDPVVVNRLLRDFILPGGEDTSLVASPLATQARTVCLLTDRPWACPARRRDRRRAAQAAPGPRGRLARAAPRHGDARGARRADPSASGQLASESSHLESESAEHDLHCFQAFRRMDEILLANFMVFSDLVQAEHYDVWIGDEAWDLDYYLHENPELKSAAYVWLTDFVGWLPMPDGGEHEAFLTADYNAEMIEQIARYPRVRDRAIFVGDPDDIVPERFGADLPPIREWTEEHFDFAGYITGFDPAALGDRRTLRGELSYREGELVCIVTVGGSAVGAPLLRRVIASFPAAKQLVPELRMIVVAGPRIDPATLPRADGLEIRPFVPDLHRHLAACDLAIVHGGLTTTMELTGNRRPFIYFPIGHHFEQNFHVPYRLDRYGAGRRMGFDEASPEAIAAVIAQEIGRTVDYRPVATDGASSGGRPDRRDPVTP